MKQLRKNILINMFNLSAAIVLLLLTAVLAESRLHLQRGLLSNADIESINQPHAYIFPHSPRGRNVPKKGFEIADENDDDVEYEQEFDHDDADEDVDYEDFMPMMPKQPMQKPKPNKPAAQKLQHNGHLLADKTAAAGILVPDGIIEVQGETVLDEQTGQATLLVPRSALDAIPNGSIVALLEPNSVLQDDMAEERANRVLVRRRQTGSRLNIRAGPKRRRPSSRNTANRNSKRSYRPSASIYSPSYDSPQRRNRRRPAAAVPIYMRG